MTMGPAGTVPEQIRAIENALQSTPTVAYTAPHDYPHGAPMFVHSPKLERERAMAPQMRLYVHIPFCNYACSFCCYAKKVGESLDSMRRYVAALKKELEWMPQGTPVSQFFVGGGTPTALPAPLLDEVLGAINARMPSVPGKVHTVETSPESVSDSHLEVLRRAGVGRISMGIQSLSDRVLDQVKRGHDQDLALSSIQKITAAGFILNIDLIYGLPGQREEDFHEDFRRVAQAGAHAVTAYSLRLNEYTSVARSLKDVERFDVQRLMRWRDAVRTTAKSFGYTQTRWHTFKRLDSIAARHERLPVSGDDMRGYQLGIGMSARSSLGHTTYRNHRNLTSYVKRIEAGESPVEEHIALGPADLRTQFIARTLGDGKGLDPAHYASSFGTRFEDDFAATLERLEEGGLIERRPERVRLSATGELLYDLVMLSFYPEHAKRWLLDKLKTYQILPQVA